MYFNVSQLMAEPSGSSRFYDVEEKLGLANDIGAQRVAGSVSLLRTDRGIWVSAVLDSDAVCNCSRCLEEFMQPIRVSMEEEFMSVADPDGGEGAGGQDYDGESYGIEDHMLDLTEAVTQHLAVCLPMKPLCRSDCKGMCATCGASLNESPCECDTTVRDRRWDPLLGLVPSNEATDNRSN